MMVLRKGKIDQLGTPEEIYYTPKVDFVGMLVGEPPMNMVDGALVEHNGKTIFKAGSSFEFELSPDSVSKVRKHSSSDNSVNIRLGVRCEYIKVSDKKMSDNSFQLPVYAVVHEAESSVITFELENSFLHSRVNRGKGYDTCRISEIVWLEMDQENIYFFEKTAELSKA
jgi:ABC-type sugar transport system ATPase subunit